MKIRNLAFCGVMASILTGWGALAADGDTVIASKAYVDAMDATKQDKNDRVTESWANSTADHDSTTKYPSMNTLDTAISGLNTAIGSGAWGSNALDSTAEGYSTDKIAKVGAITSTVIKSNTVNGTGNDAETGIRKAATASDNYLPTEKAVRNAIDTVNSALSGDITAINRLFEDGMSEAEGETLEAYEAWVDAGSTIDTTAGSKYMKLLAAIAADTHFHNVVADTDVRHQNMIPRNSDITKGIMYLAGTGIQNHKSGIDTTTLSNAETTAAQTAWEGITKGDHAAADDYVPTVASVERRVKKAYDDAVSQAGTNVKKETTNVLTSHANNTEQNGNDNKLTTVAAIAATTKYAAGTAPTSSSGRWQTTDSTATTTYASDRDLTTQKAVTQQFEALDLTAVTATGKPIVSVGQTDGLVSASTGTITYQDAMDNALKDVNDKTRAASCSESNPCVLTYVGTQADGVPQFRWTNMDTEGVNASI